MFSQLYDVEFGVMSSALEFNRLSNALVAPSRRWQAISTLGFFDDFNFTEPSSGWSNVKLLCATIGAILDPGKEQTPCQDIVFIGNRVIAHLHSDPHVFTNLPK